MYFGVLGPLVVREDGREITPPRGKQRSLLAILLLHANAAVSFDRLIDALWGDEPPLTARHAVEVHVSALRRRLDRAGLPRILTEPSGYALRIDEGELDAERFERLYEGARRALADGDASGALEWFRRAEALWRGAPFGDLAEEPFALREVARLEGLRSAARADRVDAQLAAGRHAETIPELESLAAADRMGERLHGQLMLALYRNGRQVDALRVYQDLRATLVSELGLEPGPEIERLQLAILRHDAALEAPSRGPAREPVSSEPGTVGDRMVVGRRSSVLVSTRRRAVVVAVVGIVLVATTATAWLSASTTIPPSPRPTSVPLQSPASIPVAADSVGRMDVTGTIVATVRVGAQPDAIALGAGSAWVTDATDDAVTRLDASGSTVIQRIPVGVSPAGIAFGFNAAWVANSGDRTVSRIDPTANEVVAVIQVGTAPAGIATDERWVWVTNRLDHTLSRIDPNDDSTKTFAVGATPLGVATAAGSVWVADSDTNLVVRVDAQSDLVRAQVPVGNGPSAVAATPQGDAIWVVNSRDGTVSRIDTTTASVTAAISVGADPTGIGIGTDGVWVTVSSTSEIVKIDPASDQIVGRFPVGASPRSLVVDSGGALFTVRAVEGSHRGGTLAVVSPGGGFPDTADPSYVGDLDLALMTNDALVAYKMVGGPDGLTLVPDLAASIPVSPDGGRTWTFQLRAGVTYSNGAPVRPSDVIGSFERAVIAGNAAATGAGLGGNTDIVGSSACRAKPPCDLSRGITYDDQAGTVTFHLVAADPGFPSTITAAVIVPAGTPLTKSTSPLPATGPYMVDRYQAGREAHLVRNPHFHEWSKDAQPDGYPDAIDWTVSSLADPSSLVESGMADVVLFNSISAERLAQLRTRVPAQVHVGPSQKTWFEMMNTRLPPFNDPRVRQAINYAADRRAIVDAWGGPLAARITCQVIPPEYTGYEPYCPYTVDPNANGSWLGPDLTRAQALVEQAGVKGQRVTVWGWADGGQHAAVARYFTALLNQLGFRATTRLLELDPYFNFLAASPDKVQMAGFWDLSSSRSGSDTIVGTFTCPDFPTGFPYIGQPAEFCSRPLDAQVTAARALEATDPLAANHLWAQIDQAVVDAAPAVMAFNPTDVTFVSERVGNYEHHPQYQIMLDQLWVQ